MEEIINALELKKKLDALRPIDKEQEARIMQKFRLDWNYHSNNLEGNSLTYGETKALLMFGVTAQGKPLKDHSEIKGHNEAIDWVIEMVSGNRPLTESFIRELHRLLLNELYEEKLKKGIKAEPYKTTPNHVITQTGETFYFATPEETPAKMGDLMAWYNEKIEDENVNPILLAAEFHHKFIIIHPFEDGNGRTARILMNFILMKYGFPPTVIKTEDKVNYFAALRLADAGNIEAFIEYIAKNLSHSLEIMIAGAKGESIEEPDDIDKEIALLEKRLAGYGERIEKEKSLINVNEIYQNSIIPLVEGLQQKLKAFEKHYLYNTSYLQADNDSQFRFNELPASFTSEVREVNIVMSYNKIKQKGLENFGFTYNVLFSFETLNYNVYLGNRKQLLYKPNYENLSIHEIKNIVDLMARQYILELNEVLK